MRGFSDSFIHLKTHYANWTTWLSSTLNRGDTVICPLSQPVSERALSAILSQLVGSTLDTELPYE